MAVHVVIRTCIGCRRRAPVAELVRVAVILDADSAEVWQVVPDVKRKLPGRGAWLHPEGMCLAQAERRRAFGRALRQPGQLDTSPVREYYASKSGDVTLGQDQR